MGIWNVLSILCPGKIGDGLSLLWTYDERGTLPSHPPLEQMWVVLSQLECTLLEGSTLLPPLLLCPCSEDQKCLERDITTCHFYATAMLLRILDPEYQFSPTLWSRYILLYLLTHLWCPCDFYIFFGCSWAWTFLPGWLEWLEHFIICSWGITELSEYFPMWVILMSAKAEVRF